jgi:hypothetical protein
MKRIKLFEAFSNTDKIGKVNHLLLCWCVKQFIKDEELESKISRNNFTLYKTSHGNIVWYGARFNYNFEYEELEIISLGDLNRFFIDKSIPSLLYEYNQTSMHKAAKQVIKKMYQDEKNKTI